MRFIFGKPTENPYGREKEIDILLRLINRNQPTALIGVRRIGKTSILLTALSRINQTQGLH